jgi:hypothetical protein
MVFGFTSAIKSLTILPLSSPTFMRYFFVRPNSSMAASTSLGEPRMLSSLGCEYTKCSSSTSRPSSKKVSSCGAYAFVWSKLPMVDVEQLLSTKELDATRRQSVYAPSTRKQLAQLDKEDDESGTEENPWLQLIPHEMSSILRRVGQQHSRSVSPHPWSWRAGRGRCVPDCSRHAVDAIDLVTPLKDNAYTSKAHSSFSLTPVSALTSRQHYAPLFDRSQSMDPHVLPSGLHSTLSRSRRGTCRQRLPNAVPRLPGTAQISTEERLHKLGQNLSS